MGKDPDRIQWYMARLPAGYSFPQMLFLLRKCGWSEYWLSLFSLPFPRNISEADFHRKILESIHLQLEGAPLFQWARANSRWAGIYRMSRSSSVLIPDPSVFAFYWKCALIWPSKNRTSSARWATQLGWKCQCPAPRGWALKNWQKSYSV